MKKIVFCNIMMKSNYAKLLYDVKDDSRITHNIPVYFPINAILANTLKKQDDVKVVLLLKKAKEDMSEHNAQVFMQELDEINQNIGANIEYVTLTSDFVESAAEQEKVFRAAIDQMEERSEVYVDITYGPKSLPIIMFAALNFAEKFMQVNVKGIVYGKVEFGPNATMSNPELYNVTTLYYINSIMSEIDCDNASEAKMKLDRLLS